MIVPKRFEKVKTTSQKQKKGKGKSTERAREFMPRPLYNPGKLLLRGQYFIHDPNKFLAPRREQSEPSIVDVARGGTDKAPDAAETRVRRTYRCNRGAKPDRARLSKDRQRRSHLGAHGKAAEGGEGIEYVANVKIEAFGFHLKIKFRSEKRAAHAVRPLVTIDVLRASKDKFGDSIKIGPLYLRAHGSRAGAPIPGQLTKLEEGKFQFVVSTSPEDAFSILKALSVGAWFDIPIGLKGDKVAILTIERTRYGERAMFHLVGPRAQQ